MTYAFYEVVSTEAEKEARMKQIRLLKRSDDTLCSGYIDVLPGYSNAVSGRQGLRALLNAIPKRKIGIVVIPSYESMKMDEHALTVALGRLRDAGAHIALGDPGNIQEDAQLLADLREAQCGYLQDLVCDPDSFGDGFYVDERFEPPFVYPKRTLSQASWCMMKRRSLKYLTREQKETGFYLYREDREDWFFVPPGLMKELRKLYDLTYPEV